MRRDRHGVHHVLEIQGGVGLGGAERHTLQLAVGLQLRPGFAVTVVGPYGNRPDMCQELNEAGIPLHELDLVRALEAPRTIWRLVRLVRRHRIDLIHSHLRNADLLAIVTGSLTRTPVVITLHGRTGTQWGDPVRLRSRLLTPVYGLLLRRATRCVITVSEYVARISMAELRLERSQIAVVHNGSAVDHLPVDADDRAVRLRSSLGVDERSPIVSIIGALSPRKGVDHFLRMAHLVAGERPETRFLVVGEGALDRELRALATSLGLENAVLFTGGRTDVPDVLQASDVAVATARDEGFGRAVTEAMAAGTPVVAFADGGITEIVVEGVTGFLVDHGDVTALAGRVGMILDDPGLGRRLGAAGRRRVERHFSVAEFVDRTAAVLHDVVTRHDTNRSADSGGRR